MADENVECKAANYLEKRGHDVEMVVDVLGTGTTDEEIAEYAEANNRVVFTADDDFLSIGSPTLFQEDDKMSAFKLAEIVDVVVAAIPQDEVQNTGAIELVEGWL